MVAKGEGWRHVVGLLTTTSCYVLCALSMAILLWRRDRQPIVSRGWPLLFMGIIGVALSPDLFIDEINPKLMSCTFQQAGVVACSRAVCCSSAIVLVFCCCAGESHYYLVALSSQFFACPLILSAYRLALWHKFEVSLCSR